MYILKPIKYSFFRISSCRVPVSGQVWLLSAMEALVRLLMEVTAAHLSGSHENL